MRAGAQRLIPQAWRRFPLFDNVFKLVGVPVCTVQLRYAGWVTELADAAAARNVDQMRAQRCQGWGSENRGQRYDVAHTCSTP